MRTRSLLAILVCVVAISAVSAPAWAQDPPPEMIIFLIATDDYPVAGMSHQPGDVLYGYRDPAVFFEVNGYSVRSPGGHLIPIQQDPFPPFAYDTAPFLSLLGNETTEITVGSIPPAWVWDWWDLAWKVNVGSKSADDIMEDLILTQAMKGADEVITPIEYVVPEPGTLVLFFSGALGLLFWRRRAA